MNVKLPEFIDIRIEELNIQNEDYSLSIDEGNELRLLEEIRSSIIIRRILLERREGLDYELKNPYGKSPSQIKKNAKEYAYIQKLLDSGR